MKATYTQIRDVLQQIALKMDGHLIEDKDKLLFIAEGKPLVVCNVGSEFDEEAVNNLLDDFEKIDLTIDERKTGESVAIEDQVDANALSTIKILGSEISLKNSPIIENGVLQLPVDEIAQALGYNVKISQSTAKLTKDDISIE